MVQLRWLENLSPLTIRGKGMLALPTVLLAAAFNLAWSFAWIGVGIYVVRRALAWPL